VVLEGHSLRVSAQDAAVSTAAERTVPHGDITIDEHVPNTHRWPDGVLISRGIEHRLRIKYADIRVIPNGDMSAVTQSEAARSKPTHAPDGLVQRQHGPLANVSP